MTRAHTCACIYSSSTLHIPSLPSLQVFEFTDTWVLINNFKGQGMEGVMLNVSLGGCPRKEGERVLCD